VKRHRQGLLLTLAMGTLLVIAMIATGCNGKVYSVYGRVTIRGTGVGIEDARIACGVYTALTDSSGYWGVSDLSGPTTVSVTKEGWKFEPESIQAYGGRADVDFQGHELDYRGLLSDSSQWYYDVKNTATGEPDETGWIIQRVAEVEPESLQTLFHMHYETGSDTAKGLHRGLAAWFPEAKAASRDDDYFIARQGDIYYLLEDRNSTPIFMLSKPLYQGAPYNDMVVGIPIDLVVQREEGVTVPAGTFSTWYCTKSATQLGITLLVEAWFAPYVGPVKYTIEMTETGGSGWYDRTTVALRSYSE